MLRIIKICRLLFCTFIIYRNPLHPFLVQFFRSPVSFFFPEASYDYRLSFSVSLSDHRLFRSVLLSIALSFDILSSDNCNVFLSQSFHCLCTILSIALSFMNCLKVFKLSYIPPHYVCPNIKQ